jgi:hypothetical protein
VVGDTPLVSFVSPGVRIRFEPRDWKKSDFCHLSCYVGCLHLAAFPNVGFLLPESNFHAFFPPEFTPTRIHGFLQFLISHLHESWGFVIFGLLFKF